MFKKQNRLSKTKDVVTTTKRGRSFFSPHFVIKYLNQPHEARITVVVSTKVAKHAVVRNRIKRVIRDELRKQLTSLKRGDYVIIVKPIAAKLESVEIRQKVLELLRKTRLI